MSNETTEVKNIKQIKDEAWEIIVERIPDERLRTMIFGKKAIDAPKEILGDSKKILEYVTRVLTVAFHYVYFRYKKWTIEDNCVDDGPEDNDLIRIFKVLKRLYLIHGLSYEIMESILMDLQIDIALQGSISRELRIGKEISQNTEYAKMTYLAKRARDRARADEHTSLGERIGEFLSFTNNFRFLRDLQVRNEPLNESYQVVDGTKKPYPLYRVCWNDANPFSHTEAQQEDPYGGEIDVNLSLINTPMNYLFLESVEFIRMDAEHSTFEFVTGNDIADEDCGNASFENIVGLKLNYAPFKPNSSFDEVIVGEDDCLLVSERLGKEYFYLKRPWKEILLSNFPHYAEVLIANDTKPLIEDFYAINYKYIRNLALAIVDVLGPDDQARIEAFYSKDSRFKPLFNAKNGNLASLHWDVVIAILMVEEGAGKLLTLLFTDNRKAFSALTRNLELRFGSDHFPRGEIQRLAEAEIKKGVENLRDRNPYVDVFFHDTVRVGVQVRALLSSVTNAVNGNETLNEKIEYPISIRSHILLIQGIRDDTSTGLYSKLVAVRSIVNQALATLIRFYRAFFQYAKIKKEFETDSFYRVMTDAQIVDYQHRAQDKFEQERENYRRKLELVKDDYCGIMDMLRDLCNDCALGSENQQLLHYSLGRQQILDFDFISRVLADFKNPISPDPDEDDVDRIISCALEAFYYLQSGEHRNKGRGKLTEEQRSRKIKELPMKAIFPFVTTFQYSKQTGDGYHINFFSVISPAGQEITVKVMSEFHYHLNEKYYCLPNRHSSANSLNLWIEPVMIHYQNKEENNK